MKLFPKVVSNVNLKLLNILEKSATLDDWLRREYASAGGHNTILKIRTDISLATSKDIITSTNCLQLD